MDQDTVRKMNEVLNIANEIVEEDQDYLNKVQYPETIEYNGSGDLEDDYIIARDTLKNLISSGEYALTKMENVLKDSDSPRTFEVFSTLIKSIADLTTELIKLQKTMKEISTPMNVESLNKTEDEDSMTITTDQLNRLLNNR